MTTPRPRYSVMGAARSGVAAANFLARTGHDVLLSDPKAQADLTDALADLDERVATRFGGNEIRPDDVVVISPGIPPHAPVFAEATRLGREVISEVELFARHHPGPILAVTGTDGKSTTTKLLGDLIRARHPEVFVGGNIGLALTTALPELPADAPVVAEISNAQLITVDRFRPRVAVVINIAEDHTSYHGSFDAYQAAKRRVFENMGPGDTVVLNHDDANIRAWDVTTPAALTWFSPAGSDEAPVRFEGDHVLLNGAPLIPWRDFPLGGRHNVENVLAACAAAAAFGLDADTIAAGLRTFEGLAHRMEAIRELDGVRWFNDSKATNAHAFVAGLAGRDRPAVVIAGGYDKGADLAPVADAMVRHAARAVLIGVMGPRLARAIGDRLPHDVVDGLAEAVPLVRRLTTPGQDVLLCPATSSFDQYRDFEARGDHFKALVRALPKRGET
jgi:UDP-N-acetylmuramoylalanine--D-glutamate ligase